MKKTPNLDLPIYDNPEEDIFDLEDWNIANQNLDKAFEAIVEGVKLDVINSEVADARGGNPKLKDRLDKVDSQLDDNTSKINILKPQVNSLASGSPKGVYATVSALTTAFPTGNSNVYVVSADGGWYYWSGSAWVKGGTYQSTGISDNSINEKQVSFISNDANNLFNTNNIVVGYRLDISGNLYQDVNYSLSDYIPITSGKTYIVQTNASLQFERFCVYTQDKIFSSVLPSASSVAYYEFIAPINGYIRIPVKNASVKYTQVVDKSIFTGYYPFKYTQKIQSVPQNYSIDDTKIKNYVIKHNHTNFIKCGKNIFDNTLISIGKFLETNGNLTNNATYDTSDYIPVIAGVTYVISKNIRKFALFNGDKYIIPSTFIDRTTATVNDNISYSFTPTYDCYCRFTFFHDNLATQQMEIGTTPTNYEEFCYTIPKLKAPESVDILTSKTIYNFGDSIGAGDGNNGKGYAEMIAQIYGMNCINYAVGGSTLSKINGQSMGCILDQINSANTTVPDFILIEGGANDYSQYREMGTLTSMNNFNENGTDSQYNITTYVGALEQCFRNLMLKYQGSQIVFIIVHRDTTRWNKTNGTITVDMQTMHDLTISVCKKWSIPYVDMFNEGGMNVKLVNYATTYTNNADGTHPNELGYSKFYIPKIVNKLKQLV